MVSHVLYGRNEILKDVYLKRLRLQVEVAELGQKLQTIGTLQKELELLQRQKAASEQAALSAKQRQNSGSVWGWLAGTPPPKADDA